MSRVSKLMLIQHCETDEPSAMLGIAVYTPVSSVGIELKELGGQLPKCLKFCPGIEI